MSKQLPRPSEAGEQTNYRRRISSSSSEDERQYGGRNRLACVPELALGATIILLRWIHAAWVEAELAAVVVEPPHGATAGVAYKPSALGAGDLEPELYLDVLQRRVHNLGPFTQGALLVQVEVASLAPVPLAHALLMAAITLELPPLGGLQRELVFRMGRVAFAGGA